MGYFGAGGTWIQQLVSGFTVGQTYTLSLALASEWDSTGSAVGSLVEVSFPSGSSTASQILEAPPATRINDWSVWETFNVDFVADSTSVEIRLEGLAGTGYDAGIDNVSVTAVDVDIDVLVDIKPGSCPNPFNGKSKGSVPVAIVGSADLDVTTIDPASILLAGVPALAEFEIKDSTEPDGDNTDCYTCFDASDPANFNCDLDGDLIDDAYCGDGYPDLIVKFDTQALAAAIGGSRDDCIPLELVGMTLTGVPIAGGDAVVIKTK